MAREKKRKGKKNRKGTESDRHVDVHLAPTVEMLHEHISEAMCAEVFEELRTNERQRKWSLFALARFWLAVILEPPPSLNQLLERVRRIDPRGFLPAVEASAESFFQKCKTFSSTIFRGMYCRFMAAVLPRAPRVYCQELSHLQKKFTTVVAIDGSRLDKIAHRLKILWREKAAVLPGCLLAVYDLFRGVATQLWFDPDAAASEFTRALVAVEHLEPGTLALGDRLYCTNALFRKLEEQECFGLFRRNKRLSLKRIRRLSRSKEGGVLREEWLVSAGASDPIELRLIRLKKGRSTYEALTNVLDRRRLTMKDAIELYPFRWTVERLFYDLKVVLNLKRFYAANPNAVAMQVYAAAIVHTAFRIAQADIAQQVDLPPEELSPQKLFPLLSVASIKLIEAEYLFEETCKANRGMKLRKPSWERLPDTVVSLRHIRVQRRSSKRKKRKFDPARRKWKSFTKVKGAEELS